MHGVIFYCSTVACSASMTLLILLMTYIGTSATRYSATVLQLDFGSVKMEKKFYYIYIITIFCENAWCDFQL